MNVNKCLGQINQLVVFKVFLCLYLIAFVGCKAPDVNSYKSIQSYFKSNGWSYPLDVEDSKIQEKFYAHNSDSISSSQRSRFADEIKSIKSIYRDKNKIKQILYKTIEIDINDTLNGFRASEASVVIDTSFFGTVDTPKILLGFEISRYKINSDSTNISIPCESCVLEENGKVIKYFGGVFFELNEMKDSLTFSRWD